MHLPSFTLFNLLGTMWFVLSIFATAKILTLDWSFQLKETVFFIAAAFVTAAVSVLHRDLYRWMPLTYGDLFQLFFLVFYYKKIRAYSYKKTFILTFITLYLCMTILYILMLGFHHLTSFPGVSFRIDFLPDTNNQLHLFAVQQVFFYMPFFVTPAMAVAKLTQKHRQIINENMRLQNLFLYAGIFQFVLFSILITVWRLQDQEVMDRLISTNVITLASVCITLLISLYVYSGFVDAKNKREQKESELRSLLYYSDELEQQLSAMQKFKHDYQNILISMADYINERDMEGLEHYFTNNIVAVSEAITRDSFTLQGLGKIKVREVKSIIASKIMLAQNNIKDADIQLKVNDDIEPEHIFMDTVVLVRMLGIILDNAIEALAELNGGELFIACQKWDAGVTFIVQNTCAPDIPPLHELSKPGFSTKGNKRGLGLSILNEIANPYPNVILNTSINNDYFSQKLLIGNLEADI